MTDYLKQMGQRYSDIQSDRNKPKVINAVCSQPECWDYMWLHNNMVKSLTLASSRCKRCHAPICPGHTRDGGVCVSCPPMSRKARISKREQIMRKLKKLDEEN